MPENLTICTVCGTEFGLSRTRRKNPICKKCTKRAYDKQWRKDNPRLEYFKNKINKTILRNKEYITQIKENNPCCIYGETELSCLDFHHVIPRIFRYG